MAVMAGLRGVRLRARLTLAFVGVALAAVVVVSAIAASISAADIGRLARQQNAELTSALTVAVRDTYTTDGRAGFDRADLNHSLYLVALVGPGSRVRDMNGRIIASSPGFARLEARGSARKPLVVNGRQVGWLVIRPRRANTGLQAAVGQFSTELVQAGISAAVLATLLAFIVAFGVSRLITAPIDRLILAVRRRGGGVTDARAGDVGGPPELRDLAGAFDEMADSLGRQERVRRDLVADMAHEIRTPVAVLQAGHEAMLDGISEPTPENLGSLRDEVLRLGSMVEGLQRLSAAEAAALHLRLVPHDLAAIAAEAADSLGDLFSTAHLRQNRRMREARVLCDPARMREVVTNLLTNAVKYARPAGGTVTIEVAPHGRHAVLAVRDSGIGIPPDELSRVTERFFRGRESAGVGGSGIGLTIAAELVRAHHGTLAIDSDFGEGTVVTVTLPLADAEL